MDDFIFNKLMDIIGKTEALGSTSTSMLTQTLEVFNSTLFHGVTDIGVQVARVIGYMILALIFLLEINHMATRNEGMQGMTGIELPFKLLFKFALCVTAVDSAPLILNAIYGANLEVINLSTGVFGSTAVSVAKDEVAIKASIAAMDYGVKLMTSVQVMIIWLIFKFSTLVTSLIVIGRMIQLYIMTAIAAIPMATLGHSEAKSIGINFLKSYAAVAFQGALIYIVISMYGILVSGVATSFDIQSIDAVLWEALLYSLVLVMAILATGQISKSIFNAM